MQRVIKYEYYGWLENCGCCSDSSSSYTIYEDGVCTLREQRCNVVSNDEELRELLEWLEPFDIHTDTMYY